MATSHKRQYIRCSDHIFLGNINALTRTCPPFFAGKVVLFDLGDGSGSQNWEDRRKFEFGIEYLITNVLHDLDSRLDALSLESDPPRLSSLLALTKRL